MLYSSEMTDSGLPGKCMRWKSKKLCCNFSKNLHDYTTN